VSITRLIYSSRREDNSQETLDGIMRVSRRNNLRDEITGVLVVSEGSFMQLLEGERLKVGRCLMRIMQDERHRDIQIISTNTVPNRLFPEWSMHRVEVSAIRRAILDRYLIRGEFRPGDMKQGAIEDLCRILSGEGALPSELFIQGDPASETLGMLRKIHWAARQVIGESLGSRTLKPGTLEQLHTSILRQAEEVRALQRELEASRADDFLQEEVAKLISYFDETDRDLAQRLGLTQARRTGSVS
jgi:hypothetical protein